MPESKRKRVILIVGIRANKHMTVQNRSVIREHASEATVGGEGEVKNCILEVLGCHAEALRLHSQPVTE